MFMEPLNSLETPLTIYTVIYHSQITMDGGHDAVMEHVRGILSWSRIWNPKHGITGALMLNDCNFSQVIEGPASAVKSLFGHIVCDKRHRNIELLQAGYSKDRNFGAWSMAFAGSATEPDIKLVSGVKSRDLTVGEGAAGVIDLLRWLLSEERVTTAIR